MTMFQTVMGSNYLEEESENLPTEETEILKEILAELKMLNGKIDTLVMQGEVIANR